MKSKKRFFFTLPKTSFVSFVFLFFFIFWYAVFFLCLSSFSPHTETGKVVSYRDIIVCAVSKGDLLKELWCAVISPTSVRSARAGACNWVGVGGAGLPVCSDFIDY